MNDRWVADPKSRIRAPRPLAVLLPLFGVCVVLALLIPVFSHDKNPKVYVRHSALYPFYYQTNADAPMELTSSLGFPMVLRVVRARVNRPVVIGSVAILRELVCAPVLRLVVPRHVWAVRWGDYRAVNVLATYTLWILLNCVFTLVALWLFLRTCTQLVGPSAALSAACMLCATPVVVLGIREIHLGAFELLIICASLAFWVEVLQRPCSRRRIILLSLGLGVLFLGKLAVSTFAAGALVALLTRRRKVLAIILLLLVVPTLAWILVLKILDIPYWVFELHDYYGVSLSRFKSPDAGILLPQAGTHLVAWGKGLWENTGFVHFPFFVVGCISLVRVGRGKLLVLGALFLTVDSVFYFALNRVHAIYALHSMVLYFVVVATGLVTTASWLQRRSANPWPDCVYSLACVAIAVLMQMLIILRVLPAYGG